MVSGQFRRKTDIENVVRLQDGPLLHNRARRRSSGDGYALLQLYDVGGKYGKFLATALRTDDGVEYGDIT